MKIGFGLVLCLLTAFSFCQDLSKSDLQKKLKDTAVHSSWIYDDLPAAFDQAKTSGKPVLVLFRCVP
jgi:hypothetical protein